MSESGRVVRVSEAPYLVFVLGLSMVCLIWGFFKAKAFLYVGIGLLPFALLFLGTTTITSRSVSRQSPWSNRRIAWKDVKTIEVLPNFYWVVLNGSGKRLAIAGPAVFDTSKGDLPAWYLEQLAEEQGIPIVMNLLAPFKRSRGT